MDGMTDKRIAVDDNANVLSLNTESTIVIC